MKALEAEAWDPSVKSLVPFPVVLATMNGNLTWLQQLGYAFATQQADVFAAVQRLRRLAQKNEKLQSSPQQIVSTMQVTSEPQAGSSEPPTQREVIVIQPAQQDTVYVPNYDPAAVYGSSWPSPSYPPYYPTTPPGYYFGTALATGLAFAAGAAVVGGLWGWASPDGAAVTRTSTSTDTTTSTSTGNRSIRTVWAEARGARVPAISRERLADRRDFPAVRKFPYPATRCGLRHAPGGVGGVGALVGRVVPAAWAVRARAGPVVPAAWVVSAVRSARRSRRRGRCRPARWSRRRGRRRRRGSAGWSPAVSVVSAAPVGRVVPAAWAVSAARSAGRRGWCRWPRPCRPASAVPTDRPAGTVRNVRAARLVT